MAKQQDNEDMPDPNAILARLTTALEALATRAPDSHNEALISKLTEALERVSSAQIEGAKIISEENKRAHRPSNEVVPNVSVFNRRGVLLDSNSPGPHKPPLKCIMLIPWLVEWESITREEAELLNLLQPGEYSLKRIDNSKVRVTITLDYKVDGKTPSRLVVTHDTAFNNDNFRMMPPLPDMLRQYLRQHDPETAVMAGAVLTDEEEEALIEAGELSISV